MCCNIENPQHMIGSDRPTLSHSPGSSAALVSHWCIYTNHVPYIDSARHAGGGSGVESKPGLFDKNADILSGSIG